MPQGLATAVLAEQLEFDRLRRNPHPQLRCRSLAVAQVASHLAAVATTNADQSSSWVGPMALVAHAQTAAWPSVNGSEGGRCHTGADPLMRLTRVPSYDA